MANKIGGLGHGGQGLSIGHQVSGEANLKDLLLATRAELDDLRTKYAALLVKLDADTGVALTDYVATLPLAPAEFSA